MGAMSRVGIADFLAHVFASAARSGRAALEPMPEKDVRIQTPASKLQAIRPRSGAARVYRKSGYWEIDMGRFKCSVIA